MEVQGADSERRRDAAEGDIFSSHSRYPSLGDLGYLASVTPAPGGEAVKSEPIGDLFPSAIVCAAVAPQNTAAVDHSGKFPMT